MSSPPLDVLVTTEGAASCCPESVLAFNLEWLRGTVLDVHTRSRIQCQLISFIRNATVFLTRTPKATVCAHRMGMPRLLIRSMLRV